MGNGDLVAAAFEHSFHAETRIMMVVYEQDAPVTCNSGVGLPISWSILRVPIPFDGAFNGV